MNNIKQGFDKKFGDFTQQQANIKQRVLNKQSKKRPVRWHYSLITVVLLVVMAGFLVNQLTSNEPSTAKVATLSERYFDVMYFDMYYLSQEFNRSAENYEQILHHVLQEAALIDYAESKGIIVTDEEKQAVIDGFLLLFKDGIKDSDMAAFRYQILFDEFNLTAESYAKILAEQQLVTPLYVNKLVEQLNLNIEASFEDEEYLQLLNDALQAFNAKYYDEIEQMLEDFKPISSDGISATVELLYTEYGDYKFYELEDKFYYAEKKEAVNSLLINAMPDIENIQQLENLGYLCTYTLDDYIKAAKKIANETGADKYEDLAKLLTILKQTVERY